MTIEIPVWLMWTVGILLGVPALLLLIGFAVIGFLLVRHWEPPKW